MTEWISVSEKLPSISDDDFYLARFTEAFLAAPGMYNRRPCEVVSGRYLNNFARNYTHWMRVPAPTEPWGATELRSEQKMPDDVFRARVDMELEDGWIVAGGNKNARMIVAAFGVALTGKKVLVATRRGNVVMQLQPAAPEPEIIVDDLK